MSGQCRFRPGHVRVACSGVRSIWIPVHSTTPGTISASLPCGAYQVLVGAFSFSCLLRTVATAAMTCSSAKGASRYMQRQHEEASMGQLAWMERPVSTTQQEGKSEIRATNSSALISTRQVLHNTSRGRRSRTIRRALPAACTMSTRARGQRLVMAARRSSASSSELSTIRIRGSSTTCPHEESAAAKRNQESMLPEGYTSDSKPENPLGSPRSSMLPLSSRDTRPPLNIPAES